MNAIIVPAGSFDDADIAASADIAATKTEHQNNYVYAQESGTNAADDNRVVAVVYGATGSIIAFHAGSVTKCAGDSTVTVDLCKASGTATSSTSVLSAVVTLNSSSTAFASVAGTISTATLVVGDRLEIKIDATVGTGTLAKGVFARVVTREDAV
jgi:hypothetical protein